jgi:isopropylmalate/homocitrate/citramalate synthase
MIDRDKIWAGKINELAREGRQPSGRVGLYDTTLRDGEQTVGVVLDPESKLRIARALDDLGVDRIEAGFPRVSEDDARAFAMIMEAGLKAEVWGFSRAHPKDLEALLELGVRAAVVESPVSEGKLVAYGLSHEKITGRVTEAVSHAAGSGMRVAFFGVDGSRAELGFLERIYSAAVDAGAEEVAVVDTIGAATPEAAGLLVSRCREWVGPDIPIHWHGHNDFGLATAAAIAAVRAGATWIQGTINGMGERAGNANLGEVAIALDALYGVDVGMRFEKLVETSELVRELSGYELEPWKPVTGENLFMRESGAVASQFHDPAAIEPFSAEVVNARRGLVLGKKSGLDSIRIKAEELGLDVPEEARADLLAAVKATGARKKDLVTDDEFRELARRFAAGAEA